MTFKAMRWGGVIRLILVMAAFAGQGEAQTHSELWGEEGERWEPSGRLPDFSRAGYHGGDRDLPDVPVSANVKAFGAVGDGVADDTAAFVAAIEATDRDAILIPEGVYVVTATLKIRKPNVVLRGEGPDRTVLRFPKSLQQLLPSDGFTALGVSKLKYSFGGAFIEVRGNAGLEEIGRVVEVSERGSRILRCDTVRALAPGDWIQLRTRLNPDLGRHLHAGREAGKDTLSRPRWLETVAKVVEIEGDRMTLDRPLRLDVRPEWSPIVHKYQPTVQEVGIEHFAFEFPGVAKKKHLLEEGFNAIQFGDVANSWVRNVRFVDADMGVKFGGAKFCQAENLVFEERKRTGRTGHHAIWVTGQSQACLFQDFRLETTYVHDLSLEGFAHGNVFRRGSGRSINLDHHRNGPYENLFTDLDIGDPRRLWASGGRGDRGPNSAARTTVWNLRHEGGAITLPRRFEKRFPMANVVGVPGYTDRESGSVWIESSAEPVVPADLYEAQRRRRMLPSASSGD